MVEEQTEDVRIYFQKSLKHQNTTSVLQVQSNDEKPSNNLFEKIVHYLKSCQLYNVVSVLVGIVSVVLILLVAVDECITCFNKQKQDATTSTCSDVKKYWVFARNAEGGYLDNVFLLLDRLGYEYDPNATDWDLLWAHDYPFSTLQSKLRQLEPHQKVNHIPGCGYITNKVDLATTKLKYIPPAFKLPIDKDTLLEYAKNHPNTNFVQKNNDHRNIRIQNIADIDMNTEGTFIQEFVDNPLLVSGYKFDIGIYTIITSVDPLRVYIYNGDALLR